MVILAANWHVLQVLLLLIFVVEIENVIALVG